MQNLKKNFTIFVLAVGIVLVWRGVWGLLDLYLFPGNEALSFTVSIIAGIVILYFNDGKLNELYQPSSSIKIQGGDQGKEKTEQSELG